MHAISMNSQKILFHVFEICHYRSSFGRSEISFIQDPRLHIDRKSLSEIGLTNFNLAHSLYNLTEQSNESQQKNQRER